MEDEAPDKLIDPAENAAGLSSTPKANFIRNVATQVFAFGFQVVLGMLWLTPYLVRRLGVDNYGMVRLAYSLLPFASLLTIAITGSLGRFVTLHLEKGEIDKANACFNSQFLAILGLCVLTIPAFAAFSFYSPDLLSTPAGQEDATRLLFFSVLVGFLFSTISGAFFVSTFAKHRFDLKNISDMVSTIVRVIAIVVLFNLLMPSLWQVGQGALAGAVTGAVLAYAIFRKLTPELRLRLKGGFDRARFYEMTSMGLWMAISQVGAILYLSVDLLVVNKVFGTTATGKYSVILLLSSTIRPLAQAVSSVLTPALVGYYAREDTEGLMRVSRRAVKLMSLALAIPLGILCGFSRPFLEWWLGPEFSSLSPLMWLMLSHLVVNLSVIPLFGINVAANRMALPGVVTIAGGLVNVALAITLATKTNLGYYGVALAGAICLTLKNALFTPWYAGRLLKCSPKRFVSALLVAVVTFGTIAGVSYRLSLSVGVTELWHFVGLGLALCAACGPLVYYLLMSKADREFIVSLLPLRSRVDERQQ